MKRLKLSSIGNTWALSGGGAARMMMGSFVSSAVFKCEVPDRGAGGGGPESWWYGHLFPHYSLIMYQCTLAHLPHPPH
jgi:hypothetical protein